MNNRKSRTQYAIKNIGFSTYNKILSLILSFISRTVFIQYLGSGYLGLNGLFSDVLNLLSMADLGFGVAMAYSFYEPLAHDDKKKVAALVTFYKRAYTVIALVVTIVGLLLIPFLPYLINLSKPIDHINLYYLFSLANVVASYISVYKTTILSADQRNYVVVKITMVTSIIQTILQIVVLVLFKSYLAYLIVGTFFVWFNNLYASHIASKEYPYINEKVELSKADRKDIYKNISSVFIYKVSNVLLTATDNLLISVLVGTVAVGYYSNYQMIQTRVIEFYTLLFSSITASIGNLIITEGYDKRYRVFNTAQSVSFITSGIIVPCYTILISSFIGIWLGQKYVLDTWTTLAIGLNTYFSCVMQPLWSYREATGLYRKTKWIMVICAIENLVLSVVLGRAWGVAGILFASAFSRATTYIWYEPKILFKEYFNRGTNKYYLDLAVNTIFVLILIAIGFTISKIFMPRNFLTWCVEAIVIFAISCVSSLFIYRKSEGAQRILSFIKRKILRK